MQLPIEIWLLIFRFLTLSDVCKFKFLSKRSNSIYFSIGRDLGLNFLVDNAKKIFNVDEYYETMKVFFVEELYRQIKSELNFSTRVFLRYSLENFLRMTTISNTLMHLFYCPRSFFAKSDCLLCSRLFVKDVDFKVDFSVLKKKNTIISIKDYNFNFFWDNKQQKDIINSDLKRCLNTVVIQDRFDLLFYFIEIQGRYYSNFFKCLVKVCLLNKPQQFHLITLSNELFNNFICYILRHVNLKCLNDLFEGVEINQFKNFKVINKKYKEYLKNKYES